MLSQASRWVMGLVFGVALLGQAQALTIITPGGTYALASDTSFIGTQAFAPNTGFDQSYFFTAPPPNAAISSSTNLGSGIVGIIPQLSVQWLSPTLAVLASYVVAQGQTVNDVIFPIIAAGTYTLRVFGTSGAGGGAYTTSLTPVPLPPALILFGTALVGLGWLGRRRISKPTSA